MELKLKIRKKKGGKEIDTVELGFTRERRKEKPTSAYSGSANCTPTVI